MKKKQFATSLQKRWGRNLLLKMKLTFIVLMACLMQVSATVYSQSTKFSFNFQDKQVVDVLKEIEEKSEFRFFFQREQVDVTRKIDLKVNDRSVEDILDQLFKDQGISYKVMQDNLIILTPENSSSSISGFSQQKKSVSGKVTDTSGASIPGVSVVVKGTTSGTITDANGSYSLANVPANATLLFSFVGMKSNEVSVGNKTTINVTLEEEAIGIEEVVAIGYGTQKKSNLTSSIAKIDNQSIKERPITNMGEAFAGQISGVRAQNTTGIPGADLSIKIRGVNTINGNSNPLYVIDGVPRDNMTDLNPNDVASIQVLKDASATSIYGSRGANGVILIETKQGAGNTAITVDAYYGIQDPVKMMDFMNGDEWVAYNIYARNEAWLRQGHSMKDAMSLRPSSLQIPASWTDGSRPSVDWQKAITQTAPMSSYQISSSSKSDKGSIYISGGYLDQKGIIKETFYNRLNFMVNASMNVGDKMKLGVNVSPSFSKQADQNTQGKETTIHQAVMQPPLIQLNEATVDLGYPNDFVTIYPNSVEKLKQMTDVTEKGKILSSIWGEYNILKGLTFKSQYSYDYRTEIYEYFYPAIERSTIPAANSNTSRWNDWTFQNTLNYDRTINNDHVINLLLGQSADEHAYYNISASATGFPNSLVRTLNVASTPTQSYTYKDKNRTESFFGRASYNYKDKYLFSASVRRDGSSRFGGNNKWGTFPSASIGWKMNEESFMKSFDWLSLLKIRASWGMAGNDRIGNYDYMSLLRVDNTAWNNGIQVGLAPNNLGNDNLKWETTTTRDLGLDVSLYKNRIQFNLDIYNNKTTDLLFNVPIPNSTGFSSYRTNLGEIQNKGWEIDLNTRNTTGLLKWSSSLNLSHNENKVIDMGGVQQFVTAVWTGDQYITKVGGPVSQFYVYRTNGMLMPSDFDTSGKALVPILTGQVAGNVKYVDQNADGKITSADLTPYGSNLPKLMYGFTNRFEYKGFELSILLQGQFGGDICWVGQRQMDAGNQNLNQLSRWIHSWKPDYEKIYGAGENPLLGIPSGVDMTWDGKTEYRLAGTNDNNFDKRIYDATFFKVKNVSLTYNLPKNMLGNSIFKAVKAYISVDNLYTYDNYPGVTTEANSYGNETTQMGADYTTYPLSKRYTLGVNITF